MAGALRRQRVRDPLELVRRAIVLGLGVVVEVEDAAFVDGDVLEHRAEAVHRVPDLGLGLGREPDRLGVAAAFEVEDAVVAPAVLVVSDQEPLGIGRERRLARAGEAEEDCDVLSVLRDVRRAVHRHDALERQVVVHQREDGLLDLAAVEGSADQDLAARRVEADEDLGARSVLRRVRLDLGLVQDEHVRLEAVELRLGGIDEHRLREERVVRVRREDADREAVLGIGAAEGVDHVEVALLEVRDDLPAQPVEVLLGDLGVRVAPPDAVLGAGLAHDELVLRRAAGEASRVDDERPVLGEDGFAAIERSHVELRRRRVAEHASPDAQSVGGEAVFRPVGDRHAVLLFAGQCSVRW